MTRKSEESTVARRSFLTRLSAGATAFGAAFSAGSVAGMAQTGSIGSDWKPARHAEDDWFDTLPGSHRFIFDNTTAEGFSGAMLYANNFFEVNRNAYGLEYSDMALVLVARHFSTPFAFNDAMWEKYGDTLASMSNLDDTPRINPYNSSSSGPRGMTLQDLFDKGLQIALCQVATRAYTGGIARAVDADPESIYEEVTNNLLANARLVPAGIVAVNRAQERGYTLCFTA